MDNTATKTAKTKLTVTTPLGTFTRTTARTYSHIVVVEGFTPEAEARHLAMYSQPSVVARNGDPLAAIARLSAPGVFAWCGRLDLARQQATSTAARRFRTVRIFEVATGAEVA